MFCWGSCGTNAGATSPSRRDHSPRRFCMTQKRGGAVGGGAAGHPPHHPNMSAAGCLVLPRTYPKVIVSTNEKSDSSQSFWGGVGWWGLGGQRPTHSCGGAQNKKERNKHTHTQRGGHVYIKWKCVHFPKVFVRGSFPKITFRRRPPDRKPLAFEENQKPMRKYSAMIGPIL
jgi:hypothetical protein